MAEITATITQEDLLVANVLAGNPAFVESMSQIGDVDASNLANGSVLVYKTTTNKWTSTRILDAQDVTGGQY